MPTQPRSNTSPTRRQAAHQAPTSSNQSSDPPYQSREAPLTSGEVPIAGTPFAAPYLPGLFSSLTALDPPLPLPLSLEQHFSHLACSYTSHPRAQAPTMVELKRHAQALCLLITTLGAHDEAIGNQNREGRPGEVLNFLPNLLTPYANNTLEENTPLRSLRNTLAVDDDWPSGPESRLTGCPAEPDHTSDENIGRFVQHANEMLEIINQHYEYTGNNLFAIFPQEADDDDDDEDDEEEIQEQTPRQLAKHTLLGQWMAFTQRLMRRVAMLEREVINLREAFSREWEKQSAANGETAEPDIRDSLSLSGINDALIAQLHTELNTSEAIAVKREQRARARGLTAQSLRQGSRQWQRASDGSMQTQVGGDEEQRVPDNIVAWIECSSRIYRVQGSELLFVVPAWDIRPGADKVREIEETPLVVTVPVRGKCKDCGGGVRAVEGGSHSGGVAGGGKDYNGGAGGGGKGKAVDAYGTGKAVNAYGIGKSVNAYGKGKSVDAYGKGKSLDAYGNLRPSGSGKADIETKPGVSIAARGKTGFISTRGGGKTGPGRAGAKIGPGMAGRGKHLPDFRAGRHGGGKDVDGGDRRPRRVWQESTDEYLERTEREREGGDEDEEGEDGEEDGDGEEDEEGEEGEEDEEGEEGEEDDEGGEDDEDG